MIVTQVPLIAIEMWERWEWSEGEGLRGKQLGEEKMDMANNDSIYMFIIVFIKLLTS